jgi:tetratricopeptide (TPR) repeat protein
MAEQDFSEIAKLSERFSKDPKSRIFVQLADAYRKNNMVDEALEVMKQGLQYHPQYPLAHLIMGRCFFDKRQFTQAKESFEKVIRIDPQNIVALRMLAQVCENLKDETGQIAAYKGLLTVDPLDTMAKDRLTALEVLQKKPAFYTITMAQEYERQGNLAEALKVYENLGFSDPTDLVIQDKVRELKQKASTVTPAAASAPPKKDEKVEGLEQFESYLKPHEVDINAPPHAAAGEKAVISEMPEIKPAEPIPRAAQKPLASEPPVSAKPETPTPAPPTPESADLLASVTDFMLDKSPTAPTKIEPKETKAEKPAVVEPKPTVSEPAREPTGEVAALSDLLAVDVPAPAETKPSVSEDEDVVSLTDLLIEEPKSPKTKLPLTGIELPAENPVLPEVKAEEPAATSPATPVESPAPEEVVSISDLLETQPEVKETSAPVGEVAPSGTVSETPAVDQPPVASEPPSAGIEPKAAEGEPKVPGGDEPKPESDEESKKPKEEDFKSFQDWLSGLLK